jgi:hypothetical protein
MLVLIRTSSVSPVEYQPGHWPFHEHRVGGDRVVTLRRCDHDRRWQTQRHLWETELLLGRKRSGHYWMCY